MFRKILEKLYLRMNNNLVYFDSLTEVRSRMYYDRVAKIEYLRKECMIIFIDIDCLKFINDKKGHHAGNLLIHQVALDLSNLDKTLDVCRIGGDEFIIFADKEFDVKSLNKIERISYGYYIKDKFEDVSSAVAKADNYMYIHKRHKKIKKKRK